MHKRELTIILPGTAVAGGWVPEAAIKTPIQTIYSIGIDRHYK